MALSWKVAVDFNYDGDYTDAGEDITEYVRRMKWRLGMTEQFQRVATPAYCEIVLNNESTTLSPELSALGFDRGKRVRIQSDWDGTITSHFRGFIREIRRDRDEPFTLTMVVDGGLWQLTRQRVNLGRQVEKRTDEILDEILDVSRGIDVYDDTWILDVANHHSLGTSTRLAQTMFAERSLGVGETWSYIGDTWGEAIVAYEAIRAVVEAEAGRFYEPPR